MTTTLSTLLGALTTTYTPSGSICNSIHYDTNPTPPGWFALGAIGPDSISCMPAGFTRAPQYYYSPGICPSDYTPACSSLGTTYGSVTTSATCCPTGYTCFQNRGDNIYGCTSLVTENLAMTILSVDFDTFTTNSQSSNRVISGTITTTLTALKESIQAYGVIVQRQSTDPPFVATTATTAQTGTSRTSTIASSTATTESSQDSSQGLSAGAKAGIGVGVAVGVIGIVALLLVFFRMRRRQTRASGVGKEPYTEQSVAAASNQPWQADLQYGASKPEPRLGTLQQHGPVELLSQNRAQELPDEYEIPFELSSERYR